MFEPSIKFFHLETAVGRTKKCAILLVATFAHKVYFEIPKFFNVLIALSELVSGQLLFLGSMRAEACAYLGTTSGTLRFAARAVACLMTSGFSQLPVIL